MTINVDAGREAVARLLFRWHCEAEPGWAAEGPWKDEDWDELLMPHEQDEWRQKAMWLMDSMVGMLTVAWQRLDESDGALRELREVVTRLNGEVDLACGAAEKLGAALAARTAEDARPRCRICGTWIPSRCVCAEDGWSFEYPEETLPGGGAAKFGPPKDAPTPTDDECGAAHVGDGGFTYFCVREFGHTNNHVVGDESWPQAAPSLGERIALAILDACLVNEHVWVPTAHAPRVCDTCLAAARIARETT